MNKTLLVTGGAGFVGSNVLPRLLEKKYRVIVLKRHDTDIWRINEFRNDLLFFDRDKQPLDTMFKKYSVDGIVHMAAKYIKHDSTLKDIDEMNSSNIIFPSEILQLAIQNGVKVFINTGTCFEYQLGEQITEESQIQPFDYYAATKQAFEQLLKYYADKGLRALTLKLIYPYGPKDNMKLIPLVMKSFIKKIPLELSDGTQQLNYTYVEDVADAYIRSLDYIFSDKYKKYENINIGESTAYTLSDIVDLIQKITDTKSFITFKQKKTSLKEVSYSSCNYDKANRLIGWKPYTSLEEGLSKTYLYYKNHFV